MSEYTVRPITYTAGYLTAYGAAKQGGYTGTYEEFCAAIAGLEGIVEDLNNFSVVVSTLAAGSSATASYADGVLTLGIPKGDKGDQGDQGIPGEVQDDIIADEFSSSTAYTKGTMVMKESVLYRFTADHAAGAWTGSDAETVQIGEELTGINEDVSDLKSHINALFVTDTASGAIASFPDGANDIPVKDLTVSIEPVQGGSGDPSPSNVRPITGWTGANVVRCGKNLYNLAAQSFRLNNAYFRTALPHNTDFTFSTDSSITGLYAHYSDADVMPDDNNESAWNEIAVRYNTTSLSFNSGVHKWYRLMTYEVNGVSERTYQLELGSSASSYEAYHGTTYPITWTSQGTVYGAHVDKARGKLVATYLAVTYDGSDDETWGYLNNESPKTFYTGTGISGVAGNNPTSMSNYLKRVINFSAVSGYSYIIHSGQLRVSNMDGTLDAETSSEAIAKLRTYLSNNPLTIVFEATTPTEYDLSDIPEVKTLLGQNNVFCDTGNVSVEYRADTRLFIEKKLSEGD